jgi:hypothetical protein
VAPVVSRHSSALRNGYLLPRESCILTKLDIHCGPLHGGRMSFSATRRCISWLVSDKVVTSHA